MGGLPSKTVALKATLTFECEAYRRSLIRVTTPNKLGVVDWACVDCSFQVGGCGSRAWLINETRRHGSVWASPGPPGSPPSPWN
jgi:hypothetical protein